MVYLHRAPGIWTANVQSIAYNMLVAVLWQWRRCGESGAARQQLVALGTLMGGCHIACSVLATYAAWHTTQLSLSANLD